VNRSMPNKAQKHVFAALQHILAASHFPSSASTRTTAVSRALRVLRGSPHHLHQVPSGQQKRRCPRGAEELGPGP
jgi:hypothetical protein